MALHHNGQGDVNLKGKKWRARRGRELARVSGANELTGSTIRPGWQL